MPSDVLTSVGLGAVDRAVVELVEAAGVVVVVVRRHREERVLEQVLGRGAQRRDAEPGVDDQVALPAPEVPDVALLDPVDVRFPQQGDRVVDSAAFEPR